MYTSHLPRPGLHSVYYNRVKNKIPIILHNGAVVFPCIMGEGRWSGLLASYLSLLLRRRGVPFCLEGAPIGDEPYSPVSPSRIRRGF